MSAVTSGPLMGFEKTDSEKSKLSFKQRAINASNKFRTSFGKRSRKNGKVMSLVEDVHDADELKAVDALRQALILEELLPAKHNDYHMNLSTDAIMEVLLENPLINLLRVWSLMKRMGDLEEKVLVLDSQPHEMPVEKEDILNKALARVEALEIELAATNKFEKGTVNASFMQYYKSVVEKAASKTSTSPQKPKKVKGKKTQEAVNTVNGDNKTNVVEESVPVAIAIGGAKSNGKKRRVMEK